MKHFASCMIVVIALLGLSVTAVAKENDDLASAQGLYTQGQYEQAAQAAVHYVNAHPNDKATPAALVLLGRSLDKMSDIVNTGAEQECYRRAGSPKTPACMHAYAEKLNKQYGAGAFTYLDTLVILRYSGTHYKQVADKFPNSPEAAEAAYYVLEKNVIGAPDEVLPRVQDYIKKYPKGEWNRKARLLYARLNEDLWWIHRKWAWLLYNNAVAEDDLIVRGEKYRQAALKAFEELYKKDGSTPEGRAAKTDYDLLKNNQDDGKLYGIVTDAMTAGESGFQRKRDK